MNTQKKGTFQFCFPGLLGIHRNPRNFYILPKWHFWTCAWNSKKTHGISKILLFRVPMNPKQAWKAKLEGALFLGVHNCKKILWEGHKILSKFSNWFKICWVDVKSSGRCRHIFVAFLEKLNFKDRSMSFLNKEYFLNLPESRYLLKFFSIELETPNWSVNTSKHRKYR